MSKILIAVGIVIAIVLSVVAISRPSEVPPQGASGSSYTFEQEFLAGASFGIDGENLENVNCYSDATFDPTAIGSTTLPSSVTFLTPSASLGDVVVTSLASVTSTNAWFTYGKVTAGSGTATASSTFYLASATTTVAINLTTSTAKLCVLDFE